MEREVPRRIPRVFPGIGHGEDVVVVEVRPVAIAALPAARRRRRPRRITRDPAADVVVEPLLAPQHAGDGLAHHELRVLAQRGGNDGGVELVRLTTTLIERLVEIREWRLQVTVDQTQPHDGGSARRHLEHEVRCRLGALGHRIHGAALAVHDVVVEGVFDVEVGVLGAVEPPPIGLVLGIENLGRVFDEQPIRPRQRRILDGDHSDPVGPPRATKPRTIRADVPRPRVAEPQGRQQVQRGRIGTAVRRADLDQDVGRRRLRVFRDDVEVAVVVEDSGVEQLQLGVRPAAPAVVLHEAGVRELALRILVEALHVGMRRGGVEEEEVFLHVLAVIALRPGEPEHPFLEDGILAVPHRKGEAEPLVVVRDPEDPVLAPAVGARARVVVREVIPRGAELRIILPHRPPLALREVRSPALPVDGAFRRLFEPLHLRGRGAIRHGRTPGTASSRRPRRSFGHARNPSRRTRARRSPCRYRPAVRRVRME